VKFAFIAAEKATYPVRVLCRTLAVSRAGFYAWHQRPPAARTQQDQRLSVEIQAIHAESRQRYGSPRVHAELRDRGQRLGRKRVARLMRQQNLCARRRRRFRVTTDSKHDFPVAPNVLARQFAVVAPDTAWVTDITYVRTWEGWLYLAVVMDLYSRRIVGWSTKPTLAQALVLDALLMAVRRRKPRHVLIHSDQGSQFGSDAWRRFCRAHHLEPSMSRRGNCWDNVVAESFFSSLKKERIKKRIYTTRELATAEINDYIETFYNRTRRHSHLSGVSPEACEAVSKQASRCPQKSGKSTISTKNRIDSSVGIWQS